MGREEFIKREEHVLCLADNTIKLNELELAKIIYESLGLYMPTNTIIRYMLQRSHKIIGIECGVTEETFNKLKSATYVDFYKKAPYSRIMDVLDNLNAQKFTSKVWLMYNTFNGTVDTSTLGEKNYTSVSYSGNIAEIEDFINNNNITAVIMDDITMLSDFIKRGNINIENMSFLITKIGYNFMYVNETDISTKCPEIVEHMEKVNFEWMMVEPWTFTEEAFEETEHMG